jgi:hypothetical protein
MIWGQVVESDEIHSSKTGKWYKVSSTSTTATEARIRLEGVTKPLIKPIGDTIPAGMHRRGKTGEVVDLFMVAFSGATRPADIGPKDVGPMLGVKTESEDE